MSKASHLGEPDFEFQSAVLADDRAASVGSSPDSINRRSSVECRDDEAPFPHDTLGSPNYPCPGLTTIAISDWDEDPTSEPLGEELQREERAAHDRPLDKLLMAVVAIVSGALLLFVAGQAISITSQIAALPTWARWPAIIVVAFALGTVLWAMAVLLREYYRLRVTPAITLDDGRWVRSAATTKEKVERLKRFLEAYPLDESDEPKLLRLGFKTDDHIKYLRQRRDEWLHSGDGSNRRRLERFNQEFLIQQLDVIAKQRIADYTKLVGLKTAVAPTSFFDTAIVLTNAYRLIADLCHIYNVRGNRWSTFKIFLQVLLNAITASRLEEATECLTPQIREEISDLAGSLVAQVFGKVLTKAAEGGANALLIYRLGHLTLREIRPIKP